MKSPNRILSLVILLIGITFLILSFLFPSEIQIGAFIACLFISLLFYVLYKREKPEIRE